MSTPSPKPKWAARMGSVMRRTSSVLTISRPSSAASERDTDNVSLSSSTKGRASSTVTSPPPPVVTTPSPIAESPLREAAAEAQESVGPSPLAQPITSSEVVTSTLPPAVEETQSPTGYIPPPVIDSTVGNPGAYTDVTDDLPQPGTAQDPQARTTEAEPHHEQNGEVVPENVNNVFPEPDLGHREDSEAHHHHDSVPVATEREGQEEPQQKSEPIAIPVPVPHYEIYDMSSYPMNLGSEREVWGGDHDHGAYPSSVPVVNPRAEDVKHVERGPAPNIRFVDFFY